MAISTFIVDETDVGERLDVYVTSHIDLEVSRAYMQKLCVDGKVLVNAQEQKSKYKVRCGDSVSVDLPEPKDFSGQTLPVVYEDDNVIVINKPSGILTHAKGAPLDEFTVGEFMRSRTLDGPESNRPGIVHRLDRDTSGIIICSRNVETYHSLQNQFSERKVKKKYIALLTATPKQPEATLQLPIERNPAKPQMFRVGANGKPSETFYRVLETYPNGQCLVELFPHTGRTHQLRVHMEYIGCTILGDRIYGTEIDGRLCLHAAMLEITIPGGQRKVFEAPIPEDMMRHINEAKSHDTASDS